MQIVVSFLAKLMSRSGILSEVKQMPATQTRDTGTSVPMVTRTSSQSVVEPHSVADALSVVHPLVVLIIKCKLVTVRAQL